MQHWSTTLEYSYVDFGKMHKNDSLTQLNNLEIPAVVWGAVQDNSSARIAFNTVRLGVNYHFC